MKSINPVVGGLRPHKGTEIRLWDLCTEVMASLELTVAKQCTYYGLLTQANLNETYESDLLNYY